MRQNLKGQDILLEEKRKLSDVSEFSILGVGENLNLGEISFTSNFSSSCNLSCKNDKKLTEAKT